MKTQLQKCLAALEDFCECSKDIGLPAEIDFTIETLRETLAKTDAPTSWVEMVAVNLVREGVNKHKARELAQHFHSLIQKDDVEPVAEHAAVEGDEMTHHTNTDKTAVVGGE